MGYEDVSPLAHHFLPQVNAQFLSYHAIPTPSLWQHHFLCTALRKYGPKQTDGKEASLQKQVYIFHGQIRRVKSFAKFQFFPFTSESEMGIICGSMLDGSYFTSKKYTAGYSRGGRPVAVPAVQAIIATINTFACTVKAGSGWIGALQSG